MRLRLIDFADFNFVTIFLTGTLNSDIHVPDSNQKLFADLVADMKKALKKSSAIREGLGFVSLQHGRCPDYVMILNWISL